jgi:hypothetical protein
MRATPTLSTTTGHTVSVAAGGQISATVTDPLLFADGSVTLNAVVSSGLVAGNATALNAAAGSYLTAEL